MFLFTILNMTLTEVTHGWHYIYFEQCCSWTLMFKMQVMGSEVNSVVKKIVF